MDPFFVTLITIIFMIFLGYFLKRIDFLKVTDVNALNKIVMNIALPCMIFKALYKANMNLLPTLSILPVVGLLSSFVIGIIVYFILKYLKNIIDMMVHPIIPPMAPSIVLFGLTSG